MVLKRFPIGLKNVKLLFAPLLLKSALRVHPISTFMSSTPHYPKVYRERQSRFRCGLHAVNALLKRRAYTPEALDAIADSLLSQHHTTSTRFRHPHRSLFAMGDYDVNVLLVALQEKRIETTWLSESTDIRALLTSLNLVGFLINTPSSNIFAKLFGLVFEQNRHWFAIPNYSNSFYVVDSNCDQTTHLSHSQLVDYIQSVQKHNGHILFAEHRQSSTESAHIS